MSLLILIWQTLTLHGYRQARIRARRRKTYELIRSLIEQAHKDSVGFIQIDHLNNQYGADLEDILGFGPPMYKIYRGHNRKCFISWDVRKMSEEISPAFVLDDIE